MGWLTGILAVAVISIGLISATTDRRNFEVVKNLDIFYALFHELNTIYVDETEPAKLVKTGIDAMLSSLDPYTSYIPEEDQEDFRFMTTGEYAGIGALITKRGEWVLISEPYEGMPAQVAGLKAGDKIIKIDGASMRNKETSEVSEKLKGAAGTTVIITVLRPGIEKELEISIKRQVIQINPVPYFGMINDNTGLIILNNFTQNCADEVEKAINELKKSGNLKGLILDLRGNPGGLMDEAVKVANLFLPRSSEVVSTKGKVSQWDKTYRAPREPLDTITPLAVLINRSSASASEIVAGALQDHDRALIIGQRSFGKGLVQTTRALPYNSSLKVTTAKYYIPSGRCIQAVDYAKRNEDGSVGLIPDSLMKEFKTKGGRTVLDGGGISPDITMEQEQYSNITIALLMQQTIFDFSTQYASKKETLPAPDSFYVDDNLYQEFVDYVLSLDSFRFESKANDLLNKLKDAAKKEGKFEDAKNTFEELEKVLKPDVRHALLNAREDINPLLGSEIVRRYYHEKGSIVYSLKFDKELSTAVKALQDVEKYKGMLNGTILTHAGDRRYNN